MITIANNFMITESLNPVEGDELVIRRDDQIKDVFYLYKEGSWVELGATLEKAPEVKEEEVCEACAIDLEEPVKPAPKKKTKKKE